MSDPAIEAATRAMRMVHDYPEPNRDLIVAAREALKPLRELHVPFVCGDNTDERWVECEACCSATWPCATAQLIYTGEELA